MNTVLVALIGVLALVQGFTVTPIPSSGSINTTVPSNGATYFVFEPTTASSTTALNVKVTRQGSTGTLTLGVQSCSLPGIPFLNGPPQTYATCLAFPECTITVPACDYVKSPWYISATNSAGSNYTINVTVTEQPLPTPASITVGTPVNGIDLGPDQEHVYGPFTGVADGVVDVILTPEDPSDNLRLRVAQGVIPEAGCDAHSCTTQGRACVVSVASTCETTSGQFYVVVSNPGNTDSNYTVVAKTASNPSATTVATDGSVTTSNVALYETQYFTINKPSQANGYSYNLRISSVGTYSEVNVQVYVTDNGYPNGYCRLDSCRIDAGSRTCTFSAASACSLDAATSINVGVKLLEGPSQFNFTVSVTNQSIPLQDLTFGQPKNGSVDKQSKEFSYYSIASPSSIAEGSEVRIAIETPNAEVRFFLSRNYPTDGNCEDYKKECQNTGNWCIGSLPVCDFEYNSGNFYAAVESRGNPDAFSYNITAELRQPVALSADNVTRNYSVGSQDFALFSYNVPETDKTLRITLSQFVGTLTVFISENCGRNLGSCTLSDSNQDCEFDFNCLTNGTKIIKVSNLFSNSSVFSLTVSEIDTAIPITPGTTSYHVLTSTDRVYFSFSVNPGQAIQVNSQASTGQSYRVRLLKNCRQRASTNCDSAQPCVAYMTNPNSAESGVWFVEVAPNGNLIANTNVSITITTGSNVCYNFSTVTNRAPFCSQWIGGVLISPSTDVSTMDTLAAQDAAVMEVLFSASCVNSSKIYACQNRFRPCDSNGLQQARCREDCENLAAQCGSSSCVQDSCDQLNYCVPPTTSTGGSGSSSGDSPTSTGVKAVVYSGAVITSFLAALLL